MYVVCPRKILVDIHPKILGASCVFYFRVINFYFKITRFNKIRIGLGQQNNRILLIIGKKIGLG